MVEILLAGNITEFDYRLRKASCNVTSTITKYMRKLNRILPCQFYGREFDGDDYYSLWLYFGHCYSPLVGYLDSEFISVVKTGEMDYLLVIQDRISEMITKMVKGVDLEEFEKSVKHLIVNEEYVNKKVRENAFGIGETLYKRKDGSKNGRPKQKRS